MRNFRFLQPDTIESVLKIKSEEGAKAHILAGGTNLLSYIKKGSVKEGLLLDIMRVKSLKDINETGNEIVIGSAVTIREILESPVIQKRLPYVHDALLLFANPLIRNKATMGGNIADASPIADTAPILLVLDAVVNAAGAQGERLIPLADFFTGVGKTSLQPDEIVVSIKIPVYENPRVKMVKMGLRNGTSCSVTSAAVRLSMNGTVDDVRIALGGVAPTPLRSVSCENSLKGKALTEDSIDMNAELVRGDISPISDVRGSADYRKELSVNLVKRALRIVSEMEV